MHLLCCQRIPMPGSSSVPGLVDGLCPLPQPLSNPLSWQLALGRAGALEPCSSWSACWKVNGSHCILPRAWPAPLKQKAHFLIINWPCLSGITALGVPAGWAGDRSPRAAAFAGTEGGKSHPAPGRPCGPAVLGPSRSAGNTSFGIFSSEIHQSLSWERCRTSRKHLGVEWSWQELG